MLFLWLGVAMVGCERGEHSALEIDKNLAGEISLSGEEAGHWLGTVGARGYVKSATDAFYSRGAPAVWVARFIKVDGEKLPTRLIVEIPIDTEGRKSVLERFGQVVKEMGIQGSDRVVGNRYLMVPLDE